MELTKDVILAGDFHLPDGRVFHCATADLPHYVNRLSEMTAAGLHVPFVWEHQSWAKATTREGFDRQRAEFARATIGHVTAGAGVSGNAGRARLDCSDPQDVARLRKVKFVSPQIEWDYKDPTGRVWIGPSITHIAATPVPIQHKQNCFDIPAGVAGANGDGAVLMSLASPPAAAHAREPVCLSLAGYRPVKLGAGNMADDDKEKKPAADKPEDKAAEKPAAEKPAEKPAESKGEGEGEKPAADGDKGGDGNPFTDKGEKPGEGEGKPGEPKPGDKAPETPQINPVLSEVIGDLAQVRLVLPDGTDATNFVDRLRVALKTLIAADNPMSMQSQQEVSAQPLMMSALAGREKVWAEKFLADEKKSLGARIVALAATGRIPPTMRTTLENEFAAAPLALSAAGTLAPSPLLTKVEAYEALPADTIGMHGQQSGTEVDLSASGMDHRPDGSSSDPEVAKCRDEMVAMATGEFKRRYKAAAK